ncbi:ADARB [Lepeophtheirus salmonis]|uniref:ADARB n=1 Tax=Lepeophtheirus salmonis TaxID=72036 RepID=A0A7R8H7V8_LEPSM|nr:ADARB [Lepeophtheirus salmonis]CAF2929578.1 ADARB [Lepeophtheirus salmonis]
MLCRAQKLKVKTCDELCYKAKSCALVKKVLIMDASDGKGSNGGLTHPKVSMKNKRVLMDCKSFQCVVEDGGFRTFCLSFRDPNFHDNEERLEKNSRDDKHFNVLWRESWTREAGKVLKKFEQDVIRKAKTEGYDGHDKEDTATLQWNFSGALLYSVTVITTIGYGNIAPKTNWGANSDHGLCHIWNATLSNVGLTNGRRAALAKASRSPKLLDANFNNEREPSVYDNVIEDENNESDESKNNYLQSVVSISTPTGTPTTTLLNNNNSSPQFLYINNNHNHSNSRKPSTQNEEEYSKATSFALEESNVSGVGQNGQSPPRVPVLPVLAFVGGYITLGATIFSTWEKWTLLEGAYFSFITLTTIGFGDFVPGDAVLNDDSEHGQAKLILACIYLLMGLAVISMAINLLFPTDWIYRLDSKDIELITQSNAHDKIHIVYWEGSGWSSAKGRIHEPQSNPPWNSSLAEKPPSSPSASSVASFASCHSEFMEDSSVVQDHLDVEDEEMKTYSRNELEGIYGKLEFSIEKPCKVNGQNFQIRTMIFDQLFIGRSATMKDACERCCLKAVKYIKQHKLGPFAKEDLVDKKEKKRKRKGKKTSNTRGKSTKEDEEEDEEEQKLDFRNIPIKNAIMMLNEMFPPPKAPQYKVLSQTGPPNNPTFTMMCTIENKSYVGEGKSKKEAKLVSSQKAIEVLCGYKRSETRSVPEKSNPRANCDLDDWMELEGKNPDQKNNDAAAIGHTFADQISQLVHSKYQELFGTTTYSKRRVMAAIVMTEEDKNPIVIAVTSGTKCINEIVARRCLLLYLYSQLDKLSDKEGDSVFYRLDGNSRCHLKDGVEFHLFITTSPCGDARIFSLHETSLNGNKDKVVTKDKQIKDDPVDKSNIVEVEQAEPGTTVDEDEESSLAEKSDDFPLSDTIAPLNDNNNNEPKMNIVDAYNNEPTMETVDTNNNETKMWVIDANDNEPKIEVVDANNYEPTIEVVDENNNVELSSSTTSLVENDNQSAAAPANEKKSSDSSRGMLRSKIECGMGTVPISPKVQIQTWDGVMSGACLTHLVYPIYFSTITVGSKFHPGHMKRALYDRIEPHISDLPKGFQMNNADLLATTSPETRQATKAHDYSVNWVMDQGQPEIVNGSTGENNK